MYTNRLSGTECDCKLCNESPLWLHKWDPKPWMKPPQIVLTNKPGVTTAFTKHFHGWWLRCGKGTREIQTALSQRFFEWDAPGEVAEAKAEELGRCGWKLAHASCGSCMKGMCTIFSFTDVYPGPRTIKNCKGWKFWLNSSQNIILISFSLRIQMCLLAVVSLGSCKYQCTAFRVLVGCAGPESGR